MYRAGLQRVRRSAGFARRNWPRRRYKPTGGKAYIGGMRFKKFCRKVSACIGEKKYFMLNNTGLDTRASAPTMTQISAVPQGSTDSERSGDQLTVTSLEFNYFIHPPTTNLAAPFSWFVRCVIFQYIPNTTVAQPTVGNIIYTAGMAGAGNYFQAPYAHDHRYEFRILYDKTHNVLQQTSAVYGPKTIMKANDKYIIKIPFHKLQYANGTTNGVNQLYVFFISSVDTNTTGASDRPSVDIMFKLNYHDA